MTRTGIVAYDGSQGQSVFYGIAYSSDGAHAWHSLLLPPRPSGSSPGTRGSAPAAAEDADG